MLIDKVPDDGPEAAAHRQVVHGGESRRVGGLQVFAVYDRGWDLSPGALRCRLCVWPRGAAAPVDAGLLAAMEAYNRVVVQRAHCWHHVGWLSCCRCPATDTSGAAECADPGACRMPPPTGAEAWDGGEYPPLTETYPGSGIYE